MNYPIRRSLSDCIDDTSAAKAGIDRLVKMPLFEYFSECVSAYNSLVELMECSSLDFKLLPNLYNAQYMIRKYGDPDHDIYMLFAPFTASGFSLKNFSFSLRAYFKVIDGYLPYDESRKNSQNKLNFLMDCSVNKAVKRIMGIKDPDDRVMLLDKFGTHFFGDLWTYYEDVLQP